MSDSASVEEFAPVEFAKEIDLVKQIDQIIGKHLPEKKIIYHYTPLSGFRKMVETHAMWTTPLQYMNDKKEFEHGQEICCKIIETLQGSLTDELDIAILQQTRDHLQKPLMRSKVYVASFSSAEDQLSQWRGYADNGYGYSIGFDTELLAGAMPMPILFTVLYDETEQTPFCLNLIRDGLHHVKDVVHNSTTASKLKQEEKIQLLSAVLTVVLVCGIPRLKDASFHEEKEIRICVIEYNNKFQFHERNGMLIPHIPLRWFDDRLPIKEVYIGPSLDFEKARFSLDVFLKQHGYSNVEIKPSSIPFLP